MTPDNEKRRVWSPEDEQTLCRIYPRYSIAVCAEKLGRTCAAVRNKASKLGLKNKRYWKPEEEEYVRNNYSKHGSACSKHLNRSPRSVRDKAIKMGIWYKDGAHIRRKWTVREDKYIGAVIAEVAAELRRSPTAVARMASELNQQGWFDD